MKINHLKLNLGQEVRIYVSKFKNKNRSVETFES